MTRLKKFIALGTKKKLLLIETVFTLAWARILVWLPFSKVAPSLGAYMKETPMVKNETNAKAIEQIASAISLMSRHTPWQTHCLARAFTGMIMLKRRRIESTLYLGTGKDKNGKLTAHAWLRSGVIYVTGADVMDQYTVVGSYAKTMEGSNEVTIHHEKSEI